MSTQHFAESTQPVNAAPLCYTKQEVMEKLKVSATTYHKICRSKLLESFRLYPGGPKRHSPRQLQEYLDRREKQK